MLCWVCRSCGLVSVDTRFSIITVVPRVKTPNNDRSLCYLLLSVYHAYMTFILDPGKAINPPSYNTRHADTS